METAQNVRFEPCAAYENGAEWSTGSCAVCGWLADDHDAHTLAVVARLPVRRRPSRARNERRAS
jgi:hypothetical protein